MMTKFLAIAALAVVLGTGAASAQTTVEIPRPIGVQIVASNVPGHFNGRHAFGLNTASALSRNVGPGSTASSLSDSILDSPNSGMPLVVGAPDTGNPAGGN